MDSNELTRLKERIAALEEEITSQQQMFLMSQEYLKKVKDELEESKKSLERANKYLMDGINYSTRIQRAIFQTESFAREIFPNSFIYFKPKDKLSGDVYWFFEKKGLRYAAVVDCTGHGVPGAMLVMVAISLLKEAAAEDSGFNSPSEILTFMAKAFHRYTHTESAELVIHDSFEAILISYEAESKLLRCCAMRNPLLLVKPGQVRRFDGNRFALSDIAKGHVQLTEHHITIEPGEVAYLFTDGVQDQFGGPLGRKLGIKRLSHFLEKLPPFDNFETKSAFSEFFDSWKGNQKQTDDVLLVGIQLL